MTENTHAGRLIVLTGPTAVGKGTVEAKLRAGHPEVWVSVSATTRDPRPGEVNGVNYWFLSEDEFLAKEQAGEFLETAVVHGMAHYGTLLKPVEEHLAAGTPTILEIDLQGARRVKQRASELDLEVVYVFIAPVQNFGAVLGWCLLPSDRAGFMVLADIMPHPFEALLGLDGIA